MRALLRHPGLLVVGTVAALAALEIALRLLAPERFRDPAEGAVQAGASWRSLVHVRSQRPGLHYELRPSTRAEYRGVPVETNSLGMRDDELLPDGTPGLVRIAVIGDSMVFGVGIEQLDTLPAQLERLLRERSPGRAIDVLNLGVSGYTTVDELAVLRERALPLAPALVVLAYCLNDPETEPRQQLPAHFAPKPWWNALRIGHFVQVKLRGRAVARYGGGDYWKTLHAPNGPYWPKIAAALDGFRDLCSEAHVPVVFVIQPMNLRGDPWSCYAYRAEHEFLAREARSRGFEVLDLLDAFVAHDGESLTIESDDPHYNAAGEALVARALADWCAAHGI